MVSLPSLTGEAREPFVSEPSDLAHGILSAPARLLWLAQAAPVAAFTLLGVNGTERSRTPVASNTAFEIADGTTAAAGSPAPQGGMVGRSMRSMTISGTCGKVRIG